MPGVTLPGANEWITPAGFLYGYLDTDVPGCREIKMAASTRTLAVDYTRIDNAVVALDTAIDPDGWSASIDAQGRVSMSGTLRTITWTDRLGWLLGFNTEPGDKEWGAETLLSRYASPGMIPLYGMSWEQIDADREAEVTIDRLRRPHPAFWGHAWVWRWILTMPAYGYDAFEQGWVTRGRVSIEAADASVMSGANADGALDGWVVGVESVRELGSRSVANRAVEVSMLVATDPGTILAAT